MSREEKLQVLRDKLLNEVTKEKSFYLKKDGNFVNLDPDKENIKEFTLTLTALYFIEDYAKSDIFLSEKLSNGQFVVDDTSLNIMMQPQFQLLSSIICSLEMNNEKEDTVNNIYYHIAEILKHDHFFTSEVITIMDRCQYRENKETDESIEK